MSSPKKLVRKLPVLQTCGPCRGLEVDSTIGLTGPVRHFWVCAYSDRQKIPNTFPRGQKGYPPPKPPEWCPFQTDPGSIRLRERQDTFVSKLKIPSIRGKV